MTSITSTIVTPNLGGNVKDQATANTEQILDNLAALLPFEYAQRREKAAEHLEVRVVDLDAEVDRRRVLLGGDVTELQGSAVTFTDPTPWADPVNGAALLDEIAGLCRRYIYFPTATDAYVMALWALGTYCFDEFDLFPFLGITATESESGKTT